MADYTRDQWMQVGQSLYDEGDMVGAEEAAAEVERIDAEAAAMPPETMGYNDAESYSPSNLIESAGNRIEGFVDGAGEYLESSGNALESITQGIREGATALQGRSLNREGKEPDNLDISIETNKARIAAQPDSWQKTAGTVSAYAVSGAPLAAVTGPALAGAGALRTGLVAAMESGLFSGITTQGDLGDRGLAAAKDFAMGGAIGTVAKPITNYVQRRTTSAGAGAPEGRTVQDEIDRARGTHQRVPNTEEGKVMQNGEVHDGSPVTTYNTSGTSTAGDTRVNDAYDNGNGFTLDRVDAENANLVGETSVPRPVPEGEPVSSANWQDPVIDRPSGSGGTTQKRDALRADTPDYDEFRVKQQTEAATQGRGLVDERIRGQDAGVVRERTADEAVSTLNDLKVRDEQAVTDAYAATTDRIGGDTRLDTGFPMSNKLKLLGETIGEGDSAARSNVQTLLEKYGLTPAKGGKQTRLNQKMQSVPATGDKLTLNQYQALRKELTSLWEQGNPNLNRQIEEIKGVLDEGVVNSARAAGSLEDELVTELVEATRMSREANVKWNDKTTAGKMVKGGEDTEFAKAAYKKMDAAINSNHVEGIAELRRAAAGDPKATQALEDSFEARKLSIIEKRITNGRVDAKGLASDIEALSPEMRKELWGEEGAEAISRYSRSLSLLDGSSGGGNTDIINDGFVTKMLGLLSAKHGAGTSRAVKTWYQGKLSAGDNIKVMQDASRIMNDQLPQEARERLVDKTVEKLVGTVDADAAGSEYYTVFRSIIRNALIGDGNEAE